MMVTAQRLCKQCGRGVLVAAAVLLAACAYRMDIQQGNFVDRKALDQLETGMTRKQVRFLLGTPMIEDPFHPDRWDYVYYYQPGKGGTRREGHLIVYFEGDVVASIERPDEDAAAEDSTGADGAGTENPGEKG
jgi:outer membrane protein assembly factor BamE